MDSRQSESVFATVPSRLFSILSKEVGKHGVSAINNRTNSAALLRKNGDIGAAEREEDQAELMTAIAKRDGL